MWTRPWTGRRRIHYKKTVDPTGSTVFLQIRRGCSVKPGHRPDGGTVASLQLEGEAAEPEQAVPTQMEVFQVFDVHKVGVLKELFVAGQILVRDGVQTDHVKPDSLVVSVENVLQDFIVQTGVVAEVCLAPPILIPAQMEQKVTALLEKNECWPERAEVRTGGAVPW